MPGAVGMLFKDDVDNIPTSQIVNAESVWLK